MFSPFEHVCDFVKRAEKLESLSNGSRIKFEFDQTIASWVVSKPFVCTLHPTFVQFLPDIESEVNFFPVSFHGFMLKQDVYYHPKIRELISRP